MNFLFDFMFFYCALVQHHITVNSSSCRTEIQQYTWRNSSVGAKPTKSGFKGDLATLFFILILLFAQKNKPLALGLTFPYCNWDFLI